MKRNIIKKNGRGRSRRLAAMCGAMLLAAALLTGCGSAGGTATQQPTEPAAQQTVQTPAPAPQTQTPAQTQAPAQPVRTAPWESGEYITPDAAKAAASARSGIAESAMEYYSCEFDFDDGRAEYEVEFWSGGVEYEMEIDAVTGEVYGYSTEREGPGR